MKVLHTSDLHLGHRFHEQIQTEDQKQFLTWLLNYINLNNIDILLIAGDIFDTGYPSSISMTMYYDFLVDLSNSKCKHVVIAGGNHDAPGTLNAPKELLSAINVDVVGKATEDVKDEIFEYNVNNESVIIASVPYLRDQDIRRALAGETFDEVNDRYKFALINHYNEVAECCNEINKDKVPVIALGHLFAIGGDTSNSEQTIYVGGTGDIGANDFSEVFNYVALGHLHRPQKVGGKKHIRYSGAPNVLSFSEVGYDKKVVELEINDNLIDTINEVTVPLFRIIKRIKGTVDESILLLKEIEINEGDLTPWIEVVIDNLVEKNIDTTEIYKVAEELGIKVLKITLSNYELTEGIEGILDNNVDLKEITPNEIFKLKCDEKGIILDENPDLLDAFNEALQIAKNA
ncbi:MAG: exonuclease subunit SbcD [Ichthyobacteriaceae bacterium]|nr:exonuclease subunit SbcD [Ichthyobacteriaceae bacterium]